MSISEFYIATLVQIIPLLFALICFSVIWPLSVWRRDASLVDIIWGPGFFLQLSVIAWLLPAIGDRAVLLMSIVGIWSIRLGFVLVRRRIREGHEDARYTSIRKSWGDAFWWKSLFIVFVLQAFLQWLIVLGPINGMLVADQALGKAALIGSFIALLGLALETVADQQLDHFKAEKGNDTSLMTTGLRAHLRHPNYLGEIVFWSGISMIVIEGGALVGLLSPILILVFLAKVSGVPLLDERLSEVHPEYADYRRQVPGFIPKFGTPYSQ